MFPLSGGLACCYCCCRLNSSELIISNICLLLSLLHFLCLTSAQASWKTLNSLKSLILKGRICCSKCLSFPITNFIFSDLKLMHYSTFLKQRLCACVFNKKNWPWVELSPKSVLSFHSADCFVINYTKFHLLKLQQAFTVCTLKALNVWNIRNAA